jgi:protease I
MSRIAFVLADDFEDSEFRIPYDGLMTSGHEIDIIGVEAGQTVAGKKGKEKVKIEKAVDDVDDRWYDALVIPGGYSPDHLRMDADMVSFVGEMVKTGKLIAAVCHGPQLLIEANVVRGKTMTSWPSVKTDLINAGARWVDQEVARDGRMITSRKPEDLPAFTREIDRQLTTPAEKSSGDRRPQPSPRH